MGDVYKAGRVTRAGIDNGKGFVARAVLPGLLLPGHADHGLGPLAAIMESFLAPGTHIPLHEHVEDEIVSLVPAGVMRHDDPEGAHLVVDGDHLMVMNAGRSFWHEERVADDDPPLRMLQIFVRPHRTGLEPGIQFGTLPPITRNAWRPVFGPEGDEGGAAFHVRNAVCCHDLRLDAGASVALPTRPGWRTFFFVFAGRIEASGLTFGEGEHGLTAGAGDVVVRAIEDSLVVAFTLDPEAPVSRGGTIGDGETVHRMAQAHRDGG